MAYTTVYKDIVFVEGDNPKAVRKTKIKTNLKGAGAQMKNLNNVKNRLAFSAKLHKCNCILDFKYGQKTAFFSHDYVCGRGVCAVLPDDEYDRIIKEKSK